MDQPSYLQGRGSAFKEVGDSFLEALGQAQDPAVEAFLVQLVNGYQELSRQCFAAANAHRHAPANAEQN